MTYKNEPSFALIATKNATAKNRKKRNPTTQPRDPTQPILNKVCHKTTFHATSQTLSAGAKKQHDGLRTNITRQHYNGRKEKKREGATVHR
jgi:hypothetical protein